MTACLRMRHWRARQTPERQTLERERAAARMRIRRCHGRDGDWKMLGRCAPMGFERDWWGMEDDRDEDGEEGIRPYISTLQDLPQGAAAQQARGVDRRLRNSGVVRNVRPKRPADRSQKPTGSSRLDRNEPHRSSSRVPGRPSLRSTGQVPGKSPALPERTEGGRIAITWRGSCVPWRCQGGKLRWLPGWLPLEALANRLDRSLTRWEVERCRMAQAGWKARKPTARRAQRLPWPDWKGPRWNDGRPIVAKTIYSGVPDWRHAQADRSVGRLKQGLDSLLKEIR